MSETYIKVEIVQPRWTADKWVSTILSGALSIAFVTLIAWWFFAAWFPQLGLTFWQLVLPVYATRLLFGGSKFIPRQMNK